MAKAKKSKKSTKSAPEKSTQVEVKSTKAVTKYEVSLEGSEHAGELRKVAEAARVSWREACRQALHHFCEDVAAGKVEVKK